MLMTTKDCPHTRSYCCGVHRAMGAGVDEVPTETPSVSTITYVPNCAYFSDRRTLQGMLVENMFIELGDLPGDHIGGIAEFVNFDATIGELLKTCTIKLPGEYISHLISLAKALSSEGGCGNVLLLLVATTMAARLHVQHEHLQHEHRWHVCKP